MKQMVTESSLARARNRVDRTASQPKRESRFIERAKRRLRAEPDTAAKHVVESVSKLDFSWEVRSKITSLITEACAAEGFSDDQWHRLFKINPIRAAEIRAGRELFSDCELQQITQGLRMPWENFVLKTSGSDDALTSDTLKLANTLHQISEIASQDCRHRGTKSSRSRNARKPTHGMR